MSNRLDGKKILIMTSNTGIERDELAKPMEALRALGASVVHGSSDGGSTQTFVHDTEKDRTFESQMSLAGLHASEFDALVIPGGTVNADTLRQDENAQRLVNEFTQAGKTVAAICHGPWVLVEAGVVPGKTLTSYPSIKTDLINADAAGWVDQEVKQCPANGWTLITSRKPDDIPAFNEAIAAALEAA
jgi:protease I